MLASGYAALVGAGLASASLADAVMLALAGIALVLRIVAVAGRRHWVVPPRAVVLATLAYMVYYPVDYIVVSRAFVAATLHLVCFVAAVKILTAERPRDFFFLKVIAFLELLAASILSVNITYFICLVVFLVSTIATFASGEILRAGRNSRTVSRPGGRLPARLGWVAGGAVAGILALTLVLFFLLPRTARAALERLMPGGSQISGYASEITLGQTGEVRRSGAAMMHVNFGKDVRPPALKWRGMALAEFNGWKWYNSPVPGRALRPDNGLLKIEDDDALRRPARRISYEVVLHATGTDALFIAGRPEYLRVPASLVLASPGGYRVPLFSPEGFRYIVYASLDAQPLHARLSPQERDFHLRLPPVDGRVIELARSLTAHARSDAERAWIIENYLRSNYSYSLKPLDRTVDDPLAHFLFENRRGYCEYFASAMAVLLRAVWVPSRVVTGFRGGTYNELSKWQVVRASDAHAWVEAWIDGRGWTEYDPTPADPNAPAVGAASRLSQWLDAAETFWQEWVLSYDLDRQLTLAFRAGQSTRRIRMEWLRRPWREAQGAWETMAGAPRAVWSALAAGLALMALLVWSWPRLRTWAELKRERGRLRQGQGDLHSAVVAYRAMLARLSRNGYVKAPAQTPGEFARTLPGGPLAAMVGQFTACYEALRYGGDARQASHLAALLDRIEEWK